MPHCVNGLMLLLILNWNALFGSIFSLEATSSAETDSGLNKFLI
jgi:ABC-type sulfate transport system permease component